SVGVAAHTRRLACGQLSVWGVPGLGGARLAPRRLRSPSPDGPHDPAPAADDRRHSANPTGRTAGVPLASYAATCTFREWTIASTAICPAGRIDPLEASLRLDCFYTDAPGVARASVVDSGAEVRLLALRRTVFVPGRRVSVLVAGDSAVADCVHRISMVDTSVPRSSHAAVRRARRIPGVFRSCGVSRVLGRATALQRFCSRGSAACGS